MLNPPLPCPFCGAALAPIGGGPGGQAPSWGHPYAPQGSCPLGGTAIGAARLEGWNRRAIPLSLRGGFPVFGPGEKTIDLEELNAYMAYFAERLSGMSQ